MKKSELLSSLESTDIEFLSSKEIIRMLALRAQKIRAATGKNQSEFASFVGVPYGSYIKFENTGVISLLAFVDIVRGLQKLDGINSLLKASEVELKGVDIKMPKITKGFLS